MNSFLAWIGGKRILAKTIISMMPEHHCYVEVFGGAGWVLFRKKPSGVEVWNDLNSDLVNLFRIVRNKLHVFKRRQYFLLSSREEYCAFQKAIKTGEFKDDVDRAIAFYYCIKKLFWKRDIYGVRLWAKPRAEILRRYGKARSGQRAA